MASHRGTGPSEHLTPDHAARELGREDGDVDVRGALSRLLDGGYTAGPACPTSRSTRLEEQGESEKAGRVRGVIASLIDVARTVGIDFVEK
jgi:hypothetical protein